VVNYPSGIKALPNDWMIKKEMIEPMMLELLVAPLEWMSFMPAVEATAETITATREIYNADTDPMKRLPVLRTPTSKFSRVSISELEDVSTSMAAYGLEFAFTERVRRFQQNIDEIDRTLRRVTTWIGQYVNNMAMGTLLDATNGVTRTDGDTAWHARTPIKWSEEDAVPVQDLIVIGGDLEDAALGQRATDAYVNKVNFRELQKHLINLNVPADTRKDLYGITKAGDKSIYIPAADITVHKMDSGITEGDILVIDQNISPITRYYAKNPAYGPLESVTLESGQTIPNDYGLHTHKYWVDPTHEDVTQIWLEMGFLTKQPDGGLYCPSGTYGI